MNEIGITHISISVDDIPATCVLVEQHGGTVLTDTDIARCCSVQDPDGQLIELLSMAYDVSPRRLMDLGLRYRGRDRHRFESRHRSTDRGRSRP